MPVATITLRWSRPQRLGLEVMFLSGGAGRRSNITDIDRGAVYWQTIDTLVAAGLAVPVGLPGAGAHELTDAGWKAGARLWNVRPETVAELRERKPVA